MAFPKTWRSLGAFPKGSLPKGLCSPGLPLETIRQTRKQASKTMLRGFLLDPPQEAWLLPRQSSADILQRGTCACCGQGDDNYDVGEIVIDAGE